MREITGIIFSLLCAVYSNAQDEDSTQQYLSGDKPGAMWYYTGLRPTPAPKERKYDRLIFDLSYNDWMGDVEPFKNKWSSIGLNTNLMFDIPINKNNTISLGVGICHSLQRISHSNRFVVDSTNSYSQYVGQFIDGSRRYLVGNSFSVPIELRFRSKGWKHFKFQIGGKIGYQANLFSKVVSNGQNGRLVQKNHLFPDIYRLVYSTHVRIGFRNWALFGSYNFNPLFTHEQSIKLNFIQVGLSLSLF